MPIIKRPDGVPLIPEKITVHLGAPDELAENVTLTFADYIKHIAASTIHPTWPQSAIVANIYALITIALNRFYNHSYRDQGYDFDITCMQGYDLPCMPETYVPENISQTVDDIFTSYIIRQGQNTPAELTYCNEETEPCNGLSKWGSVELSNQGYSAYDILKNYYGEDIDIVTDVPVDAHFDPYPLTPLRLGGFGLNVSVIQHDLNKIRENFPSVPEIKDENGIFGSTTEAAVKQFQKIFYLPQNGVVGNATWYKIKFVYDKVKGIEEIIKSRFKKYIQEGDSDVFVKLVQYYIHVLGCYYAPEIPRIEITGYYGPETSEAVRALQKKYNLEVNGKVDIQTWAALDKDYRNIMEEIPEGCLTVKTIYPGYVLSPGMGDQNVALIQTYLQKISQYYPQIPSVNVTGVFDDLTEAAVRAMQKEFNIGEVTGFIGAPTWNLISEIYESLPL